MLKIIMNKKAISGIVATSLLIVISVLSVIGFQSWFNDYSSEVFINGEQGNLNQISLGGVYGDSLYFKSSNFQTINLFQIQDFSGNTKCSFTKTSFQNFSSKTVLLLDMDHKNSTHIFDLSGYDNHAEINGAQCNEDGVNGNACFFNGISDDLRIPFSQSFNLTKFTIIAWAKTNNNSKQIQYILNKNRHDDIFPCFHRDFHISFEGDDVFTRLCHAHTNLITGRTNDVIKNNTWYFASVTYDGSWQKLYFNSVMKDSDLNTFGFNLDNHDLTIGSRDGWITYFSGLIDEIAIYNLSLNEDEINFLYENKKAIKYEQILSKGVKKLDISNCDLNKGEIYQVILFGDNFNIQTEFIKK